MRKKTDGIPEAGFSAISSTRQRANGRSKDVEIKWDIHPAGEKRHEWTADDQRTTLVLLVEGNFRIELTEASVTLEKQGDYATWGPGIDHSWEAMTDSIVVTVPLAVSDDVTRASRKQRTFILQKAHASP